MKFLIIFLFVLVSAFSNGAEVVKNHYALIVGVDQYRNSQSGLSALQFVNNDVASVHKLLLNLGWSSHRIKCLSGEEATKKNLTSVLNGWLRQVKSDDVLLIYWAGHGYPDLADQRKVYFACYDTDLKKPWTGYRMDKVIRTIREHGIKNVIFVADTCHAGKIITRSNGTKGLSIQPYLEEVPANKNIPSGWIFMAATEVGYQTIENEQWKNGVFTYCFVNAVKKYRNLRDVKNEIIKRVPYESGKVTDTPITPVIVTTSADEKIWDMTLHLKQGAGK